MITLTKNKAISLTKETNGATKFEARVAWDINGFTKETSDIDIMAVLCDSNKNCLKPDSENVVFYNNLQSKCGSVIHTGDERTGGKEGWDEIIKLDFSKMKPNVDTIPLVLSVFEGKTTFGAVSNLRVQIFDVENNKVVAEYYPEMENDSDNVMIIGEFINKNGQAFFKAIGNGSTDGVRKVLETYKIEIE